MTGVVLWALADEGLVGDLHRPLGLGVERDAAKKGLWLGFCASSSSKSIGQFFDEPGLSSSAKVMGSFLDDPWRFFEREDPLSSAGLLESNMIPVRGDPLKGSMLDISLAERV